MPCNMMEGVDWGSHATNEVADAKRQIAKLEAMLCAVIKLVGLDVPLRQADWPEAGVEGRELKAWWEAHQRRDASRK